MIRLHLFFICTVLPAALSISSARAAEATLIPPDYTAVYEVLRNDKRLSDVTVRLSHEGDQWTMHGYTHNTRGLADVLNAKGAQTVTGTWHEGDFIPENFKFSFSVIGYKSAWEASFDWAEEIVTTNSKKKGNFQLPMPDGAADPFSFTLNISSLLARNKTQIPINIVDEDEIKNHEYEAEGAEMVDTALGCLKATQVKRIRENSKRTSIAWYANDHDYIPLQIQHFKKKGKGLRLEIKSLDVAGNPVEPVGGCSRNSTEF